MNTLSQKESSWVGIGRGLGVFALIMMAAQGAQGEPGNDVAPATALEEPTLSTYIERSDGQRPVLDAFDPLARRTAPVRCCVKTSIPGRERGVCKFALNATLCQEEGGNVVYSCACCYWDACVAPTSGEGPEEGEAPVVSTFGSGWALLAISLILLPVAPLVRFRN